MSPNPFPSFFVTGTDTGVGKTLVSCAFLHSLRQQGKHVVGYKPVASGAEPQDDGPLVNADAQALLAAGSPGFGLARINPVCLREATAPHLAARDEGVAIDLSALVNGFQALRREADAVVVEGAGGLLVPLNATTDFSDLARALGLPVVLVVGIRLGCLNHALLSVEAMQARNLVLAGWVANCLEPDFARQDDYVATLMARIPAPLLGRLPRVTSPAEAAGFLALPQVQWV